MSEAKYPPPDAPAPGVAGTAGVTRNFAPAGALDTFLGVKGQTGGRSRGEAVDRVRICALDALTRPDPSGPPGDVANIPRRCPPGEGAFGVGFCALGFGRQRDGRLGNTRLLYHYGTKPPQGTHRRHPVFCLNLRLSHPLKCGSAACRNALACGSFPGRNHARPSGAQSTSLAVWPGAARCGSRASSRLRRS